MFPDGKYVWPDLEYCTTTFHIGEKIIIEDEPTIYVITDIQNQFRRKKNGIEMILRNIILAPINPSDSKENICVQMKASRQTQ
jgi:hypothetical protein